MSDNEQVERIYQSNFGAELFNLYTRNHARRERASLLFSRRIRVVKAMIAAMLEQEQKEKQG